VVGQFCTSIRAQAGHESLGDMLVALRLGPLAPGEAGLVVAVAAARWHPAVAAVQQAVTHLRSIELQ
jgi:molybdopterin synthase catalytic subunit